MADIFQIIIESINLATPSIVLAIFLIIIGYIIGFIAKFVLSHLVTATGVDDWFENQHLLAAIGDKNLSEIIGSIAKWYIFFIFLKQAFEIINFVTLNNFIGTLVNFVLALIVAIIVMIIGLIVGRYARNMINESKNYFRKFIGHAAELMIVYVAFVMGVRIVGLPSQLLEWTFLIAFSGLVFAVSLIIGLGFGLALKDDAKVIIKELRKKK